MQRDDRRRTPSRRGGHPPTDDVRLVRWDLRRPGLRLHLRAGLFRLPAGASLHPDQSGGPKEPTPKSQEPAQAEPPGQSADRTHVPGMPCLRGRGLSPPPEREPDPPSVRPPLYPRRYTPAGDPVHYLLALLYLL